MCKHKCVQKCWTYISCDRYTRGFRSPLTLVTSTFVPRVKIVGDAVQDTQFQLLLSVEIKYLLCSVWLRKVILKWDEGQSANVYQEYHPHTIEVQGGNRLLQAKGYFKADILHAVTHASVIMRSILGHSPHAQVPKYLGQYAQTTDNNNLQNYLTIKVVR